MLHGKAKEEFFKWLKTRINIEYSRIDEEVFNDLIPEFQCAICILWFDEIDIIINPYKCSDGLWDYEINNFDSNLGNGLAFKTRNQATTKAIEKASEIFNQLNK
jgi:hypothetical protein